MKEPHIVPDKPSVLVPHLHYEDKDVFNRLTAYNRTVLGKRHARQCGCFRCGSRFRADEISKWMHEEDGDDTALCPYCGTDAVIYGTAKFLLSAALLSQLYMSWFEEEYRERQKRALLIPDYSSEKAFLQKGIPFLLKDERFVQFVDEIELKPAKIWYYLQGYHAYAGALANCVAKFEDKNDRCLVKLRAFTDVDGCPRVDFTNTKEGHLPFEPSTEDELRRVRALIQQYGKELHGVIEDRATRKMKLYVAREKV